MFCTSIACYASKKIHFPSPRPEATGQARRGGAVSGGVRRVRGCEGGFGRWRNSSAASTNVFARRRRSKRRRRRRTRTPRAARAPGRRTWFGRLGRRRSAPEAVNPPRNNAFKVAVGGTGGFPVPFRRTRAMRKPLGRSQTPASRTRTGGTYSRVPLAVMAPASRTTAGRSWPSWTHCQSREPCVRVLGTERALVAFAVDAKRTCPHSRLAPPYGLPLSCIS